jgi:hypothetical protein
MGACLIRQVYRFANGRRSLDDTDERIIGRLTDLRKSDFRLDELLVDVTSAPSFGYRQEP